MNLKFSILVLAVLNLHCSFAAVPVIEIEEAPVGHLSADSLHAAYGEFLDYYGTNPAGFETGVHPAVLFAQELQERDENKFALQMLNFVDVAAFSVNDRSVVDNIISSAPLQELALVLENESTQLGLKEIIHQLCTNEPRLFAAAKICNSDSFEDRVQAASRAFTLMTDVCLDVAVKRQVAELLLYIRDRENKSFLEDAQLEIARSILTDAINDPTVNIANKVSFVDSLVWTFNANGDGRLGTQEQRQAVLDTLFILANRDDISPKQRIKFAEMVISMRHDADYLAPEGQRQAALELILRDITNNSEKFIFSYALLAEKKSGTFGCLATADQHKMAMQIFQKHINKGRAYQKLELARNFTYMNDPEIGLDIKMSVTAACFELLNNPTLTIIEQMLVGWHVFNARHFDARIHTHIADDEMLRTVIAQQLRLLTDPDFESGDVPHVMSSILNAKDGDGNFLASPAQIISVVDRAMTVLTDPLIFSEVKFRLTQSIIEYPDLTSAQFEIVVPHVLSWLRDKSAVSYYRTGVASRVLDYTTVSEGQRIATMAVLFDCMNDETRKLSDRKDDAKFIAESRFATVEQKAAAEYVVLLAAI